MDETPMLYTNETRFTILKIQQHGELTSLGHVKLSNVMVQKNTAAILQIEYLLNMYEEWMLFEP
jgi:hypothetical protein